VPAPPNDGTRGKVVPFARHLRPAVQYALPLSRTGESNNNQEGDKP
jgi:hypothetical protein